MTENKAEFCNKLCELLQMTTNLGSEENNALAELRYFKRDDGTEIVRPIFRDGTGENGYYDVNVTWDNCLGIISDVHKYFISKF